MIIVTADDYGKTRNATDSILICLSRNRITAISAMVFMEDSERAASLASQTGLELGLHINFSAAFSAPNIPGRIQEDHNGIISYLTRSKAAKLVYNPSLSGAFRDVFLSQLKEFVRLYGRYPDFYNGHHHLHLCANMLASGIIPQGSAIRRTFTFAPGEKGILNRACRHIVNNWISKRFVSSDLFFSIRPLEHQQRLQDIFRQAESRSVELEVHPENAEEIEFLLSDSYRQMMETVFCGGFKQLRN